MDIKEVLLEFFPMFKEEALIDEMVRRGELAEMKAGEEVLREGTYVKVVPFLISGLVKVVKQEEFKELFLYHIHPRETCVFSLESSIYSTKSKAKAIVENDILALVLPAQYMSEWKRKYPSFSEYILNIYRKRFNSLFDAFNALAFHKLDERLTALLQAKKEALNMSKISCTHQGLAEELGVARESISRAMKKLEKDKKVILHRGFVELL